MEMISLSSDLLSKIKNIKESLKSEGFVIDGVFGSYARGENRQESDIDLLYHLEETFYEKNSGFAGFKKLQEIKNHIGSILNIKVDIAPKNNLSKTAKKYILSEVVYV